MIDAATPIEYHTLMPEKAPAPACATQAKPAGQRLYEAWNIEIGERPTEITSWCDLSSGDRSKWETYSADPSTIGTANESWVRSVLAETKGSP